MRKTLICEALVCAASVFGLAGLAGNASAQCSTYTVTTSGGGTITPGVDDTGNHADDGVTSGIVIPFSFNFYGTPYNTLNVSSNGVIQFSTANNSYVNVCPQANQAAFGPAIFCFWDDLYTSQGSAGQGIFTTTSGTAPHRNFYIEYRTQFCCSTAAPVVNFEVVLHEDGGFDIIYMNPTGDARVAGNSATIGTQDAAGNVQAFNCNTANLTNGEIVSFTCPPSSQPRCSLSVGPTSGYAGSTFQAHASVIEGNPASPPYTISLDASSVGAGTVTLFDDGNAAHGDAAAGDLVFSNIITVGAATTPGAKIVTSTVTDSGNPPEFSTCTATFNVLDPAVWTEATNGGGDAGDLPPTAQAVNLPVAVAEIRGTMGPATNDADMYLIHICDPANFSATTEGGTTIDTQLWLFTLDGHGIAMDDDSSGGATLQSRLTNQFTTALPAGDYLLAITGFNEDANDDGNQLLFVNTIANCTGGTVYRCEHGPDGPGGANTINHWDTGGAYTGAYSIFLTGVGGSACGGATGSCCTNNTCRVTSQADCTNGTWTAGGTCTGPESCNGGHFCGSADFNCDGDVGTDADIDGFFACLSGICPALPCISSADFNGDGDVGTDQDIDAFFRVLAGAGC